MRHSFYRGTAADFRCHWPASSCGDAPKPKSMPAEDRAEVSERMKRCWPLQRKLRQKQAREGWPGPGWAPRGR
jgi:hypothetical protein